MDDFKVYFQSMANRVVTTGADNQTTVDLNPAFKDQMDELGIMTSEADGYFVIIGGKHNDITIENVKIKRLATMTFSVAGSLMSACGVSIGNPELIAMKHNTFHFLFKSKPEELKPILVGMLKLIDDNKLPLLPFGFKLPYIAELIAMNATYVGSVFVPKNAIDAIKHANEKLDDVHALMQEHFTTKMDPTSRFFSINNNDYYMIYKSARKVTHHHMHKKIPIPINATTGNLYLNIAEKLTGISLENVTFSSLILNYIAQSDINGDINFLKIVPGEYQGTLTLPGYIPIDFTFTIKKGEETTLGFMMEKI